MYFELKESRPHGTPENPFSQYHISDVKRAFQIPVHWHDELEIIYVKPVSYTHLDVYKRQDAKSRNISNRELLYV